MIVWSFDLEAFDYTLAYTENSSSRILFKPGDALHQGAQAIKLPVTHSFQGLEAPAARLESWKPWIFVEIPVQRQLPSRVDHAGLGDAGVPSPCKCAADMLGSPAAQGVPAMAPQLNLTCISTHLHETNVFLLPKNLCRLVYGALLTHCSAEHHLH